MMALIYSAKFLPSACKILRAPGCVGSVIVHHRLSCEKNRTKIHYFGLLHLQQQIYLTWMRFLLASP